MLLTAQTYRVKITDLWSAEKSLVKLFMVTHMHASSGVVADDRAIRDDVQISDITSATSSQLGHSTAHTHTHTEILDRYRKTHPLISTNVTRVGCVISLVGKFNANPLSMDKNSASN